MSDKMDELIQANKSIDEKINRLWKLIELYERKIVNLEVKKYKNTEEIQNLCSHKWETKYTTEYAYNQCVVCDFTSYAVN
jgi:hypothetical protein